MMAGSLKQSRRVDPRLITSLGGKDERSRVSSVQDLIITMILFCICSSIRGAAWTDVWLGLRLRLAVWM